MRYFGQQNEVTISLDADPRLARDLQDLRSRFEEGYEALYGVRLADIDVEIVSWRVTAHGGDTGREATIMLADKPGKQKSSRKVYFEHEFIDVPVYDRTTLAPDQQMEGPVIIEERETTAFVLPNWNLTVRSDGSLVATNQKQGD